MDLFEFAKTLTEAPSISGSEYLAFDTLRELCNGYFESVETLPTGCFIGYRPCGKPGAKKLLIDAHLDEIGFLVKEICDDGFLKVTNVGGIDTRILSASEVYIYGEKRIPAVFCSKPPHLAQHGDDEKKILLKDMYLDTGLSKEEVEKYVRIGTPAGFKVTTQRLLNSFIVGKGFDDKICVTTIMRAIDMMHEDKLNVDIYCLFSGGEEIGYIGGKTGSYKIDADYAVVIDVSNAYIPEALRHKENVRINQGGVVSYSSTTSRWLTKKLIEAAKEEDIPYQAVAEAEYTGTNATATQITRNGIPSVLISVPLKNMHTSAEVISLDDVENTAKAVRALALRL